MAGASKVMIIQSLLLIVVALSAPIVLSLIHHSDFDAVQAAPYTPTIVENPDDSAEVLQTTQKQSAPHISISTKPNTFNERAARSTSEPASQLDVLRYDGYMQIGNGKIAWLSTGRDRLAVVEGATLNSSVRIDKIHKNFLVVSIADGRVVKEIPFTQNPDERNLGTLLTSGPHVLPPRSEIAGKTVSSAQSTLNKRVARSTTRIDAQSRPVDRIVTRGLPPSPTSGVYDSPPVPTRTLPAAVNKRAAPSTIYTESSSEAVKAGEIFTVRVKIDNGLNVYAIPFEINYDPGILEITSLNEGSYLRKDGSQTTFLTSIDRNQGKVTVGLTRLGRIGGVSGSGDLMSISFRSLSKGTSYLSFTNGKPVDPELNSLPLTFAPNRIVVQ